VERICAEAKNVVGMKEATGNVVRCQELVRRLGDRLTVLSGDDALTLPMMSVGARGVISVTSNVLPAATSRVTTLWAEGKIDEARRAHFDLLEFHALMFVEPNPAPAKAALAELGAMSAAVRGPMVAATDGLVRSIKAALAEAREKRQL
jgi:4-hydroxy-tetrahydrodipicolinate synthase